MQSLHKIKKNHFTIWTTGLFLIFFALWAYLNVFSVSEATDDDGDMQAIYKIDGNLWYNSSNIIVDCTMLVCQHTDWKLKAGRPILKRGGGQH